MEHLEVHTGDKPFLCEQCDNTITTHEAGIKVQVIVDTGAKMVQCDMCGKKFTQASNLAGHIVVHETLKPYQCDRCHKYFESPTALKTHMEKSHSDNRLECEICLKTFSTQGNLCKHRRLHETTKPFPCEICKKSYMSESYLKSHMWEHVSEKPFECDICKKRFPLLMHLKRHLTVHSDNKPHQCDICKKQFPTPGNLKRHKQTHILYECQVCGKRYSKLDTLKEHLTDHLEEKAFCCEICDRRFKTEMLLNAHKWVHTREKKPYFCSICKLRFPRSKELKEHKAKLHGEVPRPKRKKRQPKKCVPLKQEVIEEDIEEPFAEDEYKVARAEEPEEIRYVMYEPNQRYPCDICGKTFKSLRIKAQHARIHDSSKCFKCDICDGTFQSQTNLRRHIKVHSRAHPYQCSICDKSYKTVGALKTHMWDHNDIKPFECEVCQKKFSQEVHVKRHMIVHAADKKFKCEICNMTFTQSGNYKRHKLTHSGKLKSKCPICEKMFPTVAEMKEHLEQHNTAKHYQCRFCQRRYASESLLKGHMWSHAEKKHYCKKCNKRFASRVFLRRHMTMHAQQEKPSAYQCEICDKRFLKLGNYQAHITQHGLQSKLQCTFCNISFANNRYIDKHMKENHPDSSQFKCTFCEESFLTSYMQIKHIKTKHEDETRALFPCEKCDERFTTQDALTAHQVDHGVQKPFRCSVCAETFSNKLRVQLHMRIHREAFNCRYCSLVFPSATARDNHVKTMTDAPHKPFNCKTCKKMFSSKQRLQRHVLVHTGERPFPCKQCGRRFTQAAHLKDHMRLHTGEKPFLCSMCDKRFTHSRTLRCHRETCRGKQLHCPCGCGENNKPHKAFQCVLCKKRFRYQKNLKMHIGSGSCANKSCLCGSKGQAEKHTGPELEGNSDKARLLLHKIEMGSRDEAKDDDRGDEGANMDVEDTTLVDNNQADKSPASKNKPSAIPSVNMENTFRLVETILEAAENSTPGTSLRSSARLHHFACDHCSRVFTDKESRTNHIQDFHNKTEINRVASEIIIKQEPKDIDDIQENSSKTTRQMDNSCQTDTTTPGPIIEPNPKYRIVYVKPDGSISKPVEDARPGSYIHESSVSKTIESTSMIPIPETLEVTSSVEQLIEAASLSETLCITSEQSEASEILSTLSGVDSYTTYGVVDGHVEDGQVLSIISGQDYTTESQAVTMVTDGVDGLPETLVLDSIPADAVRIIATRPDNNTDTIIIKIEYDDDAV